MYIYIYNIYIYGVRVCVCVCERERERLFAFQTNVQIVFNLCMGILPLTVTQFSTSQFYIVSNTNMVTFVTPDVQDTICP
jgi:hypothetical protein